ncbi:uncharacterized protein C8Q71DRAFT_713152 [Rhodofomes roseus]|uniref:Uncharacterized protein n=1 Tax=Rhodofomes roseus TaxID=34475 RepID=A0ABQ8K7W3_9APHY|nr:uncharacterized protein C8Q71DRAFT_713152 [Rhodofomes roseus]KAH9833134.1 hypothetical protein C8Q71DRAFT_713152 [Rhodofomes roseus]
MGPNERQCRDHTVRWTDNYNTEMFERLHIDLAKDAWRATNHRDEFPQMMRWVTRQEKMMLYKVFQKEHQVEEELEEEEDAEVDTADADSEEASTENPSDLAQTFLPFERVDIYHQFKFKPIELSDGREELDAVKAIPAHPTKHQKARFDTVIVLDKGDAESTGVIGTRAARVKIIFALPKTLSERFRGQTAPSWWPSGPLAYVEWYSCFASSPDPTHLMYTVSKPPLTSKGLPQGKIIPLTQIRQSCQLAPCFPDGPSGTVPDDWSSNTVLETANQFHVNNWTGLYAYQTLW